MRSKPLDLRNALKKDDCLENPGLGQDRVRAEGALLGLEGRVLGDSLLHL